MKKPEPITINLMDYHHIIKFIEHKYKIQVRDYLYIFGGKGKKGHFTKYQDATGDILPLKENDPDYSKTHAHFQRYKTWTETNPEPEYLDYWHWLIDNHFSNIQNPCTQYWNIKDMLYGDNPKWIKDITQLIYDEFKDNLDEDGGFEVNIAW